MIQLPPKPDVNSDPDSSNRLRRIRHVSRLMATACLISSGLLFAAVLLYWTFTPAQTLFHHSGIPGAQAAEVDTSIRILAFGISMLPLGALIFALLSIRRCFKAFAAGQIFTRQSIAGLKAFSIGVAAAALLQPLAGAVVSALLSMNRPAGSRMLAISIGSDTLIALIFAATVAVISWVMSEALHIAEENQQFI